MLIEMGVIQIARVETEQPVPKLSNEVEGLHGAVDGTNKGLACVNDDIQALKLALVV